MDETSKAVPPAPMPQDKGRWRVAPAPDGRGLPDEHKPKPPHRWPRFWIVVAVLLAINWLSVLLVQPASQQRVKIPFSPYFLHQVQAGQVKSISSKGDTIQGTFTRKVVYPSGSKKAKPTTLFSTQVPAFWDNTALTAQLQAKGVEVNAKNPSSGTSLLAEVLLGFGPTLLLVGLFYYFSRRAQSGGLGGIGNFGRTQARRVDPAKIQVTFADVAGIDEAKAELAEIVDILKAPDRYVRLGARIPHGVLLFGAPGTGKTLVARAVAGEAEAAFFSIAASEFIEAIVGVGAARVRDLFAKAKEAAPSIIFIDELDAIGRSRQGSAGVTGANDEREQTLDQILTEMDGFESTQTVVVIGATNRPEILDPALLRPGRFDRRVAVQAPDRDGRVKILQVHTRSMPLGDDVDLEAIASTTPGMVGADLANLANEAALLAARREHTTVQMADFTDSLEKILLGAPRGLLLGAEDRERTAYHESGPRAGRDADLRKPIPCGKSRSFPAGKRLVSPSRAPTATASRTHARSWRQRSGSHSAAASPRRSSTARSRPAPNRTSEQLTEIARQMVGRWGMSDKLGPRTLIPRDGQGPLLTGAGDASPQTQWLIDEEVQRIVDEAHVQVTQLLTEHREQLDNLSHALLAAETLDAPAAYAAASIPMRTVEVEDSPERVPDTVAM